MPITDEDKAFFANRDTTLAAIKAAGWYPYRSSSGRWWFDRANGGGVPDHFFLPQWVHELENNAETRGCCGVRANVLDALGIESTGAKKTLRLREDTDDPQTS